MDGSRTKGKKKKEKKMSHSSQENSESCRKKLKLMPPRRNSRCFPRGHIKNPFYREAAVGDRGNVGNNARSGPKKGAFGKKKENNDVPADYFSLERDWRVEARVETGCAHPAWNKKSHLSIFRGSHSSSISRSPCQQVLAKVSSPSWRLNGGGICERTIEEEKDRNLL